MFRLYDVYKISCILSAITFFDLLNKPTFIVKQQIKKSVSVLSLCSLHGSKDYRTKNILQFLMVVTKCYSFITSNLFHEVYCINDIKVE